MAYKFQLGKAKLSGSIETAQEITSQGGLTVNGLVDLDAGVISNTELEHSTFEVNGLSASLGGQVTLDTDDVGEGSSNLYWTVARGESMFDTRLATKDTDDLAEGSNLYYTNARARAAVSAGAGLDYDSATGAFSVGTGEITNSMLSGAIASSKIAELNSFDTDDLAEGTTNKYYLDSRARAAVSVTDAGGDGSLSYDSATGVITYTGPSASEVRAHLSAGDGLSYSGGQFAVSSSIAGAGLAWSAGVLSVDTAEIAAGLSSSVESIVDAHLVGGTGITYSAGDISLNFAEFDSDDVIEGATNLFFTDARARAAVSAANGAASDSGSLAYNSSTGVFTLSPAAPSWAKGLVSATNGAASNSGSLAYDSSTGTFTFTPVSSSWVRGLVQGVSGIAYNSANGNIALSSSVAGVGLSYSSGIVNLNVDTSTVEVDAGTDTLRVKDLGISTAKLADLAVTNGKIADATIANGKLVNSSVTVNGTAGEIDVVDGALSLGGTVTLGLADTITGNRTFSGNVTINNLNVTGTMTAINTTNLEVKDARILMASGSTAWATDVGFDFGSHAGHGTLLTAEVDIDGVGGADQVLSSSLPLVAPSVKASSFYGNLVGSMQLGIEEKSVNAPIGMNVTKAMANITLTLPSSPVIGQEHRVKCFVADVSIPAVVVQVPVGSGATIEGASSVTLESYGAAVSLVWDGAMWMIF